MKIKNNTDRVLFNYLTEDAKTSEAFYENITEEAKEQTIREIAVDILKEISEKLNKIDTTPIDKSHGDVKKLRDFNSLQSSINQLEKLINKASDSKIFNDASAYIKIICKSVLYLNQYSKEFKEAYTEKKTLIILKYQSLICAVFSSVAYLISALLEFKTSGPEIKKNASIEFIAPLKTLYDFNNSVEYGQFRVITKDLNIVHEEFADLSKEQRESLTEANDVISLVLTGLKNMYASADEDGTLTGILYKAAGAIMTILSLREIFYALFRAKTKLSEVIDSVKSFGNLNGSETFSKLANFASSFKKDAEQATIMSKRDIDSENREIISASKNASTVLNTTDNTVPSDDDGALDF